MKCIKTTVLSTADGFLFCASSLLLVAALALPARADSTVAAPSAPSKPLRTYTPKAGENLDRVIKQTMADSPLKIELLRKAFVDLNGHAFIAGKASKMRPNVTLQVPDSQRMVLAALGPQVQANLAPVAIDDTKSRSGSTSGGINERRDWIRYP